MISAQVSTSGNKLFIKDASNQNSKLITILDHVESDTQIIQNTGSKLYLTTNLNAPNKKIITVDAANPTSENWKDFIPETAYVLSASSGGGYFFTEYMVDAVSKVLQYDFDGNKIRENSMELIQTLIKMKPSSAKGTYIKSVYLSSTMTSV